MAETRKIMDYGKIPNSHIVRIFGDEMTYHELMYIANKPDNYTELKTEEIQGRTSNTFLFAVYFNGKIVLEKIYEKYKSSMLFYHLGEIEDDLQQECEMCVGCEKMKKIVGRDMGGETGVNICIDCWS